MFINKIYDRTNKNLLGWYLISKLVKLPPKGRIPDWYKQSEKKLNIQQGGDLKNQMEREWYTNILSNFNYKYSRKDIFIGRIKNDRNERVVVFGESLSKKQTSKIEVMNVMARHMILEGQFTLVRCPECIINQDINKNKRYSFKCFTKLQEARAITNIIVKCEDQVLNLHMKMTKSLKFSMTYLKLEWDQI